MSDGDLALDKDAIETLCQVDAGMGKDIDTIFDLIDG